MLKKLKTTLEMIKIEHTIFALPFAFLGAFMAAKGIPEAHHAGWILVAMVGARSSAMAFNRLVDSRFDALNPRTSTRAIPQGQLSRSFVWAFVLASTLLLLFAAYQLNPLALKLSPVALGLVFFYSFTKRFTWFSHLFLGTALSCAPIGAWIAIRGELGWEPLLLGLAVALWVAGLDIIYACQDVEFDRGLALHSIPSRFGIRTALWVSGALHAAMIVLLACLFWSKGLLLSLAGLALVGLLLAYEHALVKPSDLSRVNVAFFTINGWISILLFVITSIDILRSS